MKTVQLAQGSDDWHAHRAKHYNASEAAAMLGVCKHLKRDALIEVHATGITAEYSDYVENVIFAKGHHYEDLARPLAENFIDDQLSPVIGTEGQYSASYDGITFDERTNWEHKSLNQEIAACKWASDLHIMYRAQMEQQLMLMPDGARTLFMASKWDDDDKLIDKRFIWYKSDPELRQSIIDGWVQFAEDVKNYKPPEVIEKAIADPIADLPLPAVIAEGRLVQSNLPKITPRFDEYLASVNTELTTDQHFADATENAKQCRSMAKKLRGVADAVIAQMASVAEVDSVLRQYESKMDAMGLRLEKLVKAEKEVIKKRAIVAAQKDYNDHAFMLDAELDGVNLPSKMPDYAGAIKGVRTVESMQSRINDALAAGKAELTGTSKVIKGKLAYITEAIKGNEHLFDIQLLVQNDIEHIKLQIKSAISEDKERTRLAVEKQKAADAQAAQQAEDAERLSEQRIADEAAEAKTRNERLAASKAENEAIAKEQAEQREELEQSSRDALAQQLTPYCTSKARAKKLAEAIAAGEIPGAAMNYLTSNSEVAA